MNLGEWLDFINKTDDEKIIVEEVEVSREVGEKGRSKVRKRKR